MGLGAGARLRPFFGGPVITASEHWEKAEPELLLDPQSLSSIFVVSTRSTMRDQMSIGARGEVYED